MQGKAAVGAVHSYKAGDSFLEVVNTWHNGENKGKTPAKVLVFGENPKPWRSLKLKSRNRGSSTSQRLEVYNPTNDSEYPARR